MIRSRTRDPLDRLTPSEKRSWRVAERRARHEHETEQLAALLGLAASGQGVTGLTTPPEEALLSGLSTPFEMIIDGRRVRAARVHRRSLSKLREALSNIAAVPLTTVGRYGPYWVLTFRLATEQLVLLVEQLTLLPDWGGPGGRDMVPLGPLASLGA
jgi:hypothetical protein